MEWVSNLEGIDSVSFSSLNFFVDLIWGHSVVVHAVIESDVLEESHAGSRDKEVTLGHDSLDLWVLERMGTEGSGTNLFLSVIKELWVVDDSKDIFRDLSAFDGDFLLTLKSLPLLGGDVLGDWNGEKMPFSFSIAHGFHVHDFHKFHFAHKSLEWESPSLSNSLQVFSLLSVDVDELESSSFSGFCLSWFSDQRLSDLGSPSFIEDAIIAS